MLRQVFHLDGVETAKAAMQGDVGEVDALDLHTLHQFTAEMQSGGRRRDGTLVLGVDGLEVVHILLCGRPLVYDVTGQRCRTEGK